MLCPIDGTELVMTDRAGVEVDYCPSCRGVWLDRGELDKIIERSVQPAPMPQAQPRYDSGYGDKGYKKRKKRVGWLEEIFDFD